MQPRPRRSAAAPWRALLVCLWALSAACRAPDRQVSLDTIAAAVAPDRTLEGRLAGIRQHRRYRETREPISIPPLPSDLLEAARRTQDEALKSRTADSLRAAANVELLLGSTDKAVALLKEAVDREPSNGSAWNDLAVAYLHSSSRSPAPDVRRVAALEAALAATELAPTEPAGWFNLGVIASWLSLKAESDRAWQRFLTLEGAAGWQAEARERQAGKAVRQWGPAREALTAAAVDDATLGAIAKEFPQPVEELLLDTLLPAWAQAHLDGDAAAAARWSQRSQVLAEQVSRVAGDRYLTACVATLSAAFAHDAGGARGTALARAHLTLAEGRRFYEVDQRVAALAAFNRSRRWFRGETTPCREWLSIEAGIRAFQDGKSERAFRLARGVARKAAAQGYLSLVARGEWLQAVSLSGSGRLDQSVLHYERAAQLYEQTRQTEHTLFVRSGAADAFRLLGETDHGWSVLLPTVHAINDINRVRRRYGVLLNASLYAASHRLLRAALAFHQASLAIAFERNVPNTIVEGLIRGAHLALQLGRSDLAAADLTRAEQLLPSTDAATRQYQQAWLDRERGELNARLGNDAALRQLDGIVRYFSRREPVEVPQILLARGRAARVLQRPQQAEASFTRGITAFTDIWAGLTTDQHQVSFLSEAWDLFDEMVELRASLQDPDAAFKYSELARSYGLAPGRQKTAPADLRRLRVTGNTVLVYFASLRDELLIWRVDSGGIRHISSRMTRAELASRAEALRRLIEASATAQDINSLGREIYDALLTPLGPLPDNATLVLLPDGDLPGLPFAALVNPRTGRFLVEEHRLVMAPSVRFFTDASRRLGARRPARPTVRIAAIGNTMLPPPGLPPLPGATQELTAVSMAYGTTPSGDSRLATPARFSQLALTADVIHFAGHARANVAFPSRSSLVLAPDAAHPEGALLASEIETWRLVNTRLVVLSACQTAFGGASRNPGLLGLARPFLLAGVPSVVGSLWDVDDRQTLALMTAFHRGFAGGADASSALRDAQLKLLHGTEATGRLPRSWAAFLVVGGLRQ